jgi:20S proteasome alpha/beta subunit
MTIACGFRCLDGVLLCADSQITIPAVSKYAEPKIGRLVGTEHAIFVTFAGDLDFSRMCIEILTEKLYDADRAGTDVIVCLRQEAQRIHKEYYGLYEGGARLELWMLAAIHTDKTHLYKVYGPSVSKIPEFEFIGCGQYLARAVVSNLYSPNMSLVEASLMAAYVLSQAKLYVDGCGGRSEIVRVFDTNAYSRMEAGEIEVAEKRYEDFLESNRTKLLRPQANR